MWYDHILDIMGHNDYPEFPECREIINSRYRAPFSDFSNGPGDEANQHHHDYWNIPETSKIQKPLYSGYAQWSHGVCIREVPLNFCLRCTKPYTMLHI